MPMVVRRNGTSSWAKKRWWKMARTSLLLPCPSKIGRQRKKSEKVLRLGLVFTHLTPWIPRAFSSLFHEWDNMMCNAIVEQRGRGKCKCVRTDKTLLTPCGRFFNRLKYIIKVRDMSNRQNESGIEQLPLIPYHTHRKDCSYVKWKSVFPLVTPSHQQYLYKYDMFGR